jgi:hypothetical protein
MADADTVLAKLDETVQAFDEAYATLVDSSKLLQTWRTELADAGHPAEARSATDIVSRLHAARQHAMGLVWTLKGCTAAVRREVAGQKPPPRPAESPGNLRVRGVVAAAVAVFSATDMVLDLLGKPWISDRLFWAVMGVALVVYAASLTMGTRRQRRLVLFALAGVGAGVAGRGVAAKVTGWHSDDWRTAATATAVLLAAVVVVEILRRRRHRQ